eukprot:gene68246-93505_t
MSFDHWLIRDFPKHAPGIPAGLTAYGKDLKLIEAHFSMLAHELSFTSYAAGDLPNPFVSFVREKLKMPVITWTVHDQPAIDLTLKYADQMTFEGFEPDLEKGDDVDGQTANADYSIRIAAGIGAFTCDEWNGFAGTTRGDPENGYNPLVSFAFLSALEDSGCAVRRTGWQGHHLRLETAQGK